MPVDLAIILCGNVCDFYKQLRFGFCLCCRHIIICGGITFETLTTVVKNFIHEDAAMEKTDIVIIDM